MHNSFNRANFALIIILATLFSCDPFEKESSKPEEETKTPGIAAPKPARPTFLTIPFEYDFDSNPTITVYGVTAGDTVKIFSDPSCKTLLKTSLASSTSTEISLGPIVHGCYSFYANTTNETGTSVCSSSVSYNFVRCPSGYIKIPGNSNRNISPFCVMKFEAKNADGVATSKAATAPWRKVSPDHAKTLCTELGRKYNLISNQEWMTIADNIAKLSTNHDRDSNPSTGFPEFPYGNSGNYTPKPVSVNNENDYWDQAWANQDWNYRRVHFITNGEIIWDFTGNANELVDWSDHPTEYTLSPGCGIDVTIGHITFSQATTNCPEISQNNYMPLNPKWNQAENNIGTFRKFANDSVLIRSGSNDLDNISGIYLFFKTSIIETDIPIMTGFRCVYRPYL